MNQINSISFVKQTDINAFLSSDNPLNKFNQEILDTLTDKRNNSHGLFEPLLFFNMLYNEFAFIKANKHDGGVVIAHLQELNLGFKQNEYFLYKLSELIREYLKDIPNQSALELADCRFCIQDEFTRIKTEFYEPDKYEFEKRKTYIFENQEQKLKSYIPKKDLEEYMNTSLNVGIYETLTQHKDWKNIFEPLIFLNLLYKQFQVVEENKNKPIAIKEYLINAEVTEDQHYFLFHFLIILYIESINRNINPKEQQLAICFQFLYKEYETRFQQRVSDRKAVFKLAPSPFSKPELENKNEALFRLSEKSGARIDMIRILYTLHELKIIELSDGSLPSKTNFMNLFGEFLGTDFSNYNNGWSQAINNSKFESNVAVFRKMIKVIENQYEK